VRFPAESLRPRSWRRFGEGRASAEGEAWAANCSSAVNAYVNYGEADSLKKHTKGPAADRVHRFGEAFATARNPAPRLGAHA
jgi:hypothetical protein